jgi:hypothetical protein
MAVVVGIISARDTASHMRMPEVVVRSDHFFAGPTLTQDPDQRSGLPYARNLSFL